MNIARLSAFVANTGRARVRTLSLCVRFSNMVAREHPELAQYDREMGEWGSSFHELYFGAQYFGHASPLTLISEAVANLSEGKDIFRTAPWYQHRHCSDTLIAFRSRSVLEFCELVESFSTSELEHELETHPPGLVGFSVTAQQVMSAAYLARRVRAIAPRTTIVFGGPAMLPRTLPMYRELFPEVDYFVHGDGENALCEIFDAIAANHEVAIEGVLGSPGPTDLFSRPVARPPVVDIPSLVYSEDGAPFDGMPLTIWFGRGCSWGKCVFCSIPQQQRRSDNRPTCAIHQELVRLHGLHGTRRFRFGDWEINGSRKDLLAFCKQMVAADHDFEFWAEVNARNLDMELVGSMRAAGFVSLQVGLEAFCDSLLHKINKPARTVDNVLCMKLAHFTGIELFSNLICNVPGESHEDISETLKIMKALRHLMRPPVKLALIEFLMELDADVFGAETSKIGEAYTFERRCFPDQSSAPHFLRSWLQRCAPGWATVQRELDLCARKDFYLRHEWKDDTLLVHDGRTESDRASTYVLRGLEAKIYACMTHEIRNLNELDTLAGGQERRAVEQVLERLTQRQLIVRSGGRVLGLSTGPNHQMPVN